MSTKHRLALVPVVLLVAAACSRGGAAASPAASSAPPSTTASASPATTSAPIGAIDHATGPTDVLLRYENGGGFVAPSALANEAPIFTLYGDGTVVFRNPALPSAPPIGSVYQGNPFRTVHLDEDQIQELLAFALGNGGLGVARASYENHQVADAPTAVFTIDAGGLNKTVSIYALGMELPGGDADGPARASFQGLADRLGDFVKGGTSATDVYAPTGYRATLAEGSPAPDQIKWPWTDLKPTDFAFPIDPNAFQSASLVLTPAQVDALGFKDVEGGLQGLAIESPDGSKVYGLSLRPLLPDETR
jgi:hypothetical protein